MKTSSFAYFKVLLFDLLNFLGAPLRKTEKLSKSVYALLKITNPLVHLVCEKAVTIQESIVLLFFHKFPDFPNAPFIVFNIHQVNARS